MKLAENFSLWEFKCKDGSNVPDELMDNVTKLAKNLQVLRDMLDKPIRVISGYRSKRYNTRIAGARRSQHLCAAAADIKIKGMTPAEVKSKIEWLIKEGEMHKGGIGIYRTFVHYDVRGWNARWKGRGVKDDRP